jgi:hypothetical protein
VVYNAAFEKPRLRECVEACPEFADWLEKVLARVVDLLSPFSAFDVYCPSQHGSASIKQVLPALTGQSYAELAIRDGAQASEAFKRVTFCQVDPEHRREVRQSLEKYCRLDTQGMLDIVTALRKLA